MGGKHIKAMVKRVMAKLFKDELLKDFSYTGKKGKKKFCDLGCCSVIFGKYYIIIVTILQLIYIIMG